MYERTKKNKEYVNKRQQQGQGTKMSMRTMGVRMRDDKNEVKGEG